MASTELRPRIFVGSSKAGLNVARMVQRQLQEVALVQRWDELSVTSESQYILEMLINKLDTFDFGVLVFTPDDKIDGKEMFLPRDNVLIEFGLCIGRLTRERTFVLAANDPQLHIPSDLGGFIHEKFTLVSDVGTLLSEIGPACTGIAAVIQSKGKLDSIHRLASEVESQKQKIDDIVRYGMSDSIFHHLAGMALLKNYIYHDNDANRRELYFLRDAGYIRPRLREFIDFNRDLDGVNLIDQAEPTPIGYLCVRFRRNDVPPEMITDTGNLRVNPDEFFQRS